MYSVNILLPSYRPHYGWDGKVAEAMKLLQRHFKDSDIQLNLVIVNDGSPADDYPDDLLAILSNVSDGRFTFLTYDRNCGKGFALRYGARHAKSDYTVYTDLDFPFGWEPVAQAIEKLIGGADVVMGQRSFSYKKQLSPVRRVLSGVMRRLNKFLLGIPEDLQDAQSGLKGFNANGRDVFLQTTVNSFIFDSEFIMMACNRKLVIETVELKLESGVKMSHMGVRVMLRENLRFIQIFLKHRIFGR